MEQSSDNFKLSSVICAYGEGHILHWWIQPLFRFEKYVTNYGGPLRKATAIAMLIWWLGKNTHKMTFRGWK